MFTYLNRSLDPLRKHIDISCEALAEKSYKHKDYGDYARSITGVVIGYCLRIKERIKSRSLSDAKIAKLNTKIQSVCKKTKDDNFKKLSQIKKSSDAWKVANEVLLKIEKIKKELDALADAGNDEKKLKELVQQMYRGRYFIQLIARAYGLQRVK